MRVLFLITGLSTGGAEMMLFKVLSGLDREQFEPEVVTLVDRGTIGERIEALGIPVHSVGMQPGRPTPGAVMRLLDLVRRARPDMLQGWMYHGNVAAQICAGVLPGRIPTLWNVRQSLYSLAHEKPSTAAVIRLGAAISNLPRTIVYNTEVGAEQHQALGYRADKTRIIPNGFDTDVFAPSSTARLEIRRWLGLPEDAFLVGMMARFHPMKDHANFLRAAGLLAQRHGGAHFVLAGSRVDDSNSDLTDQMRALGLEGRVHLLGETKDMARLTAALDISTSASAHAEGFPNVLGEAMACGVPCVVTDVGDSPKVVADTGRIVPPKSPEALAQAWLDLASDLAERSRLGAKARERVIAHYSLESVIRQYESLFQATCAS